MLINPAARGLLEVEGIKSLLSNPDDLEKEMLQHKQAECPVIHRFSPGIYIREVNLPAGILAVGHYQKERHLNVFLTGRVTMFNSDGSQTDLVAPMIFTGEPGRKSGYIHEDVVWLNIYATDETDVETLESTYLDKSEVFTESVKPVNRKKDRKDFKKVVKESRFSYAEIHNQVINESDQIPMPDGSYKFTIAPSDIDGRGIFATAGIEAGEIIGIARIGAKRTPVGRFGNHAKHPNAEMQVIGQDIYLVALRDIAGYRGGFLGEEITTNYRNNIMIAGELECQA